MNSSSDIKLIYGANDKLLARVIKKSFFERIEKTEFFSDEEEILQCGVIVYKANLEPKFHMHHKVKRDIIGTSESLFILSGIGFLEVFERKGDDIQQIEVSKGDLINLVSGAHRILPNDNDLIMIEVKNGPYVSRDADKLFIDL
tara:strand:+ start:190 stop:621 length:432 start_codon:yes stop_codon:yes gene_type:complete